MTGALGFGSHDLAVFSAFKMTKINGSFTINVFGKKKMATKSTKNRSLVFGMLTKASNMAE